MLNPDGTIYTENLRTAKATDQYMLSGKGVEEFEPAFTFHGFRYVEITGLASKPIGRYRNRARDPYGGAH